jgi:hypothetical protein
VIRIVHVVEGKFAECFGAAFSDDYELFEMFHFAAFLLLCWPTASKLVRGF